MLGILFYKMFFVFFVFFCFFFVIIMGAMSEYFFIFILTLQACKKRKPLSSPLNRHKPSTKVQNSHTILTTLSLLVQATAILSWNLSFRLKTETTSKLSNFDRSCHLYWGWGGRSCSSVDID